MASRKEQKEQARTARLLAEAEASAARQRKRRMWRGAIGATLLVALVAGAVTLMQSRDTKGESAGSTTSRSALPGLQDSEPPWPPEYASLESRIGELGLPDSGQGQYHVHTLLTVYANGEPVEVPGNIGLAPGSESMSPIHTHNTSGVVHVEASKQYPFVLGDIFSVWGVPFSATKLGGFRGSGADGVSVYVNGKPVDDRENLKVKDLDNVVVAFGKTDGLDTEPDASALQET